MRGRTAPVKRVRNIRRLVVAALSVLVLAAGASLAPSSPEVRGASLRRGLPDVPAAALPQGAAIAWCGAGETADDRLPESSPYSSETIRVLYVYPSDAPDRFEDVADAIVADVASIDAWWRGQDPGRALRWDLYAFAGCEGGVASLDLGVLQLDRGSSDYAASSGFARIVSEVTPHLGPTVKALVYYDGFVIDRDICGVSQMAARNGGVYGVSVVSLASSCWVDVGAGERSARIAAHELVHNLGAVSSKAPKVCGNPANGGHVCDSTRDLMFPYASSGMRLPDAILDVDRNDYYGHSGEWWDVQDSAWLVHLPFRTVAITVSGPGSVSSQPAAIACPGTCSATVESDFAFELVALPEPSMEFYGWTGACTGEKPCRLTMTSDLSVGATFGPPRPTLVIRVKGKGRVTSSPPGVTCPGGCSAKYPAGTVTLRARASAGWRFARWSSSCGTKPVCSLRLTADRTLAATFVRR